MPKVLLDRDVFERVVEPEILPPARVVPRRPQLEREESEFARTSAQLRGIEKNRQQLESELRGPVSSKYPERDLEELASFADRLVRDNARKQAEPDIVARNIRRTTNQIAKLAVLDRPRARSIDARAFQTAWVSTRRVDLSPRTVFGTDAWMRTGSQLRKHFITKVLALPCVERSVRREVLFAKGKGGRGYRVSHRVGKFSDIWC